MQFPTLALLLKLTFAIIKASLREIYVPTKEVISAQWLIAEKVIAVSVSLITTTLVARYLAPELFGRLSYLTSIAMLLSPVISLGLNGIVIRELVDRRADTGKILGTAFALRLGMGCIVFMISWGVISHFRLDEISGQLLFLIGASVFDASMVFDSWLQSRVLNRQAALCRLLALLLATLARISGVYWGLGLDWFVWTQAGQWLLVSLLLTTVYLTQRDRAHSIVIDNVEGKHLMKSGVMLMVSGVAAMIYLKIDQIMIGNILGDTEVGYYSIAVRLSELWYFVPQAIVMSFFPRILELRRKSEREYESFLQNLSNTLLILALIIAVIVSLYGDYAVMLLFGSNYMPSSGVLVIHIWGSLIIFHRVLLSRWLIAENLLGLSMMTQVAGAAINIVMNAIFIPKYGITGAAYTTLVSYFFSTYLVLYLSPKGMMIRSIFMRSFMLPVRCIKSRFS